MHAGRTLCAIHTGQAVDAELARVKLITAEIQAGQGITFAAKLPNGSVFFRYGIYQSTRFGIIEGFFVVIDHGNRCGKGIGFTQYTQIHTVAHIAVTGNRIRACGLHAFGVGVDFDFLHFCMGFGSRSGFIGGVGECACNHKRH